MTCLTCNHAALRDRANVDRDRELRRMAARGFINCTRSLARASFHAADHECEQFAPAPADVVRAREEWSKRRAA